MSGYSAAVNELTFGGNGGFGGACGRCFEITPTKDPNSPESTGPFGNTIVVKVNDLCNALTSNPSCAQSATNPLNNLGQPVQCVKPHVFRACDVLNKNPDEWQL